MAKRRGSALVVVSEARRREEEDVDDGGAAKQRAKRHPQRPRWRLQELAGGDSKSWRACSCVASSSGCRKLLTRMSLARRTSVRILKAGRQQSDENRCRVVMVTVAKF
jgi:hypothetical protein